jgi:hypothetical protein
MSDGFELIPLLWPLIFAALVIGGMWLSRRERQRRRAAALAFTQAHGWTFTEEVPALVARWRSAPFGQGRRQRATNVITGAFHGRQIVSFDYQYTTGSGKNQTTWAYHVVALSLPVPLPWLQLSPDGAGAAVDKLFGGQDVEFESEAFNKAWRVEAPPGQYAYDFIHPRMMDRLMAPDAVGKQITVEGADIMLAVRGKQVLEAVDVYVNLLYGIADLIPRHLWLKVGYDPLARQA